MTKSVFGLAVAIGALWSATAFAQAQAPSAPARGVQAPALDRPVAQKAPQRLRQRFGFCPADVSAARALARLRAGNQATRLAAVPGVTLNPAQVQTNIVIFNLKTSGWSSSDFLQTLAKRGVLGIPVDNERDRMVTHLDVDRNDVEKASAVVQEVLHR